MITHIDLPTNEDEETRLREYLEDVQPEDIAEYVSGLEDRDEQIALIKFLEPEDAAIVFFELDDFSLVSDVLLSLPRWQAMAIAAEIPNDDAADLLADMPDKARGRVLALFDDEARVDIIELLGYEADTAGGLMTTEFVVVPAFVTAQKAIEMMRAFAPDAETIYYVYVIDGNSHLVGILSLRELIIAGPETAIADIMQTNVMSVNVQDDQEEIADLMTKYNFLAVPVVDDEEHIIGIITVDDIVDVIHEEATEDIYRMAGINESEDDEEPSVKGAYMARMPWLLITIFGELGSGIVLSGFQARLEQVVALAIFIPLLTGVAGNVGTQSSTVTVRGLAMGTLESGHALRIILRETTIGLALGVSVGLIVGGIGSFWQFPALGLAVGLTLVLNNLMASFMGTLVPLTFKRINVDPAVASAPFITTVVDITGLLNYTLIAAAILNI
ncbi:magnesium transporter [Peptococcus simiae]|uniref:magnesium transporter n=1 Tax=Peptococcus simiae TaxID=1643805 RepID=UPI00397F67E9